MFLNCLRKELLQNIKSARFLFALTLLGVGVMAATVIRTALHKQAVRDYHQAATDWYATRVAIYPDAFQSAYAGAMDAKMPNPVAILAGGLENDMSVPFRMAFNPFLGPVGSNTGQRALHGYVFHEFLHLDLVLLVAYAGSLLALLLVFDSVSGERERGTLAVMLAGPTPRDTIIGAKIAAGMLTLAVPLLLMWVIAVFWVLVPGRVHLSPDDLARIAVIAALSLLYVAWFSAFGTAVSCWVHRSATSLGICLLAWVFFALVLPNTVPILVRAWAPSPPVAKMELEKQSARANVWKDDYPGWARQVMAETGARGWKGVWEAGLGQRIREKELALDEDIAHRYNEAVKAQTRLTQAVSRLSPVASYAFCATHMAGTGVESYHSFVNDVDQYFRECGMAKLSMDEERSRRQKEGAPEEGYAPDKWPRFRFSATAPAAAAASCWLDAVVLIAGTVFLLLFALVGFLRYDAR
jgi:hypothetical protein